MKAFKKGQPVTFIKSWDDMGTFYFQHAVVYSCGTKQMVLTDDATGMEIGRHFAPFCETTVSETTCAGDTFHRLSDDEATEKCLQAAKIFLVIQRKHYQSMLDRYSNDTGSKGYCDAIRTDMENLHEPRAHHHQLKKYW